jgi:TPR repeat protein
LTLLLHLESACRRLEVGMQRRQHRTHPIRTAIATLMATVMAVPPLWAAQPLPPWPASTRATEFAPVENDAVARRCDQLADAPNDPLRVGTGVVFERIQVAEALSACEQAAVRQPRARYQFLYGRVLDAARRYPDAVRNYTLAKQAGYAPATYSLANLYASGAAGEQNKERAGALLGEAAAAGIVDAYLMLGALALSGQAGVPQDRAEAARWYEKAGDAGLAEGYTARGEMLLIGPTMREAAGWLQRGAQGGSGWAAYQLGWLYEFGGGGNHPKDEALAARYYAEGAAAGIPESMYAVARVYRDGKGVARDPATAYRWFLKAAQQPRATRIGFNYKITDAQWEVGSMLYNGIGVTRDPRAAAGWLRQASDAGFPNPLAQQLLATMYDTGDGVTRNPAEAVALYRKATQRDYPYAMTQLGMHLRQGVGVPRNEAEAMQWFRKAAERGYAAAEAALGYGYMSDLGAVRKDYPQAAFWLDRAARHGDASAQINLAALHATGWGVKNDMERARQLLSQAAASPIPEYASAARQRLSAIEDAQLEAAKARFIARRQQQQQQQQQRDGTAGIGTAFAVIVGAAFLLSVVGSKGGGQGGHSAGASDPYDDYLKRQEQQQFDDALARLARSGTADCHGRLGCASQ